MAKKEYMDKVIIKRRMLFVFCILLLLFFALVCRLSYITIAKSEDYKNIAENQWTSEVKIEARRGKIVDRNGNELAVSANVYRVDLDMNTLRKTQDKNKLSDEDVALKLGSALSMEKEEVLKILHKKLPGGLPIGSATLKRRIDKEEADKASDLKIRGIIVSPDTKRYYPNNNFLAHVLGHTRSDGDGLTGVELKYNKYLAGIPGVKIAETDNKNQDLPYTISEYTKPVPGSNVMITIDDMIQHFCEKAADQALSDNKAKAVTIMVMNPKNGEMLAMVNKPDYNPNSPWKEGKPFNELQKDWRNRAVSDTFEPGSIFKVITATAAMEEKAIDEEKYQVNCNGGLSFGRRIIHCWKRGGHGTESFQEILKNSCNVGFMDVGKKLGAERLNKYIQKFGFGQKTGIDLPGEAGGIIKKTQNISETDLATISFGQTNTVTGIQYLSALNVIANGGTWVRPHVMKEIYHYDEANQKITDKSFDDYGKREVVDKDTMARLRGYLEKVVSEGGGSKAFVEGYNIAGKTGTAQKVKEGGSGYAPGKYVASFGGMAPAQDPKITVFISIDEPDPSNYYAGQIAAPVAKQVFTDIFNYMSLKEGSSIKLKNIVVPEVRGKSKEEAIKILKESKLNYEIDNKGEHIIDMTPKPGYAVDEGSKIVLYSGTSSNYNKEVVVPSVKGYGKEKAIELLKTLGIDVKTVGEGVVTGQSIEAGKKVNKGTTTIILKLQEIGD